MTDKLKVVARRAVDAKEDSEGRRGNGYEFEYKLSNGQEISNNEAWQLAKDGKLEGVIGSHNHGRKHIKAIGDGDVHNNLNDLPTF